MTFNQKLIDSIQSKQSHLCVGLDSRYDRLPEAFRKDKTVTDAIVAFNTSVVDATADLTAAYKMNVSFYSGFGAEGLEALRLTTAGIRKRYPDIVLIADAKRSEMGESVDMTKREIFDWLGFDCVMVTPWFGFDTAKEYLTDATKGVCVYVHDSNPSASEFQDLILHDGKKVYEAVADRVAHTWNINGNVFIEAGATYPEALIRIREIIGQDMVILVAGIGPQGGKVESLRGLFGKDGGRLLVNSSRGIIFAGEGKDDYMSEVRNAAMSLRDMLRIISKGA